VTVYFDSNVLVAAAIASHPHHGQAEEAVALVRANKNKGVFSAHGLAELYAVLTRLPLTPAVYPSEAWQILKENVLAHFELIALTADEYRAAVQHCAVAGWVGGRVYDVLHVASARKARCERIYTFNLKHFRELAPDWAERIRTP
jgi:predicted nucleic acid-binding protein